MSSRDKLPEFYKRNFIEFNPFFPDSKLTALRMGLAHYYETYSIWRGNFYEYFHVTPGEILVVEAKGHGYLERYFSSITFIHLSFEQFLQEILESKSPMLAKLNLNKQYDITKILTGKIESDDYSAQNYVDYSVALERIEKLITNHSEVPAHLQLDVQFHFLRNHIQTLKELSFLRNDIIHSGKHILNKYAYECFFVNQLLPLIREYLSTQPRSIYLERNLHCEKNVIDEIVRFPLPLDFQDATKYNGLTRTLARINHFKELGRASYNNPINMKEEAVTEEQRVFAEEVINKREREKMQVDLHVAFRQQVLGHYEVHICPCCGTESLTTYEYWIINRNNRTRVQTAECAVCTYKVNIDIGEPMEFGLMSTKLFKFVDEPAVMPETGNKERV